MEITVKAHFNKMAKDSKKEGLEFWITGEDERRREISDMTREVVLLKIVGEETQLTCEFKSLTKDSKKTKANFILKGDTSAQVAFEFYKFAGKDLELVITESQMDLEDFKNAEPHEGIKGTIDKDGTATVDPNQGTIDDKDE